MPFLCFRLALVQGTSFIFALYRPCDDGVEMMDKIAEMIDSVMSDYPFASIHLCGDFNVHHKEWLQSNTNPNQHLPMSRLNPIWASTRNVRIIWANAYLA